ncbi:MAG TPA: hypothetical protein VE487_17475 [Ilumatobacter sp.]|nr:hypothetical protein [Ilumatobacter sp.]
MRDDLDAVVVDRFRVLDQVPVPDTWTRVQSKVLDHVPIQFTEEETTMIDLEAPSKAEKARKSPKRLVVAGLLAAATVVAIALVAIYEGDTASPADQPSPTVTAAPSVPPRALFGTPDEQFVPGTYFVDEVDGTATPRIFITLDGAWTNLSDGWSIDGQDLGVITFSRPDRVFADACHADEGFHPGPVTTLDGLVTALSEQRGWAEVTTPSSITVNGYAGKEFQRTAPADFTGCNSGNQAFRSWETGFQGWSNYEPNEVETLRVLDVDGTIIILNARLKPDQNDANAVAGLVATLDTIRIEQP